MYMLRTRLASFMAGFASAAAAGFYYVQSEIHTGHRFIADQVNKSFTDLEARISRLESSTHPSARESSEQGGVEVGEIEPTTSAAVEVHRQHSQEGAPVLEH